MCVVNKLFTSNHLAVEEAEANFGAVNHAAVVLHVDAALLPAAGWVVGRIPLDVLYRLQIFMGHFLPQIHRDSGVNATRRRTSRTCSKTTRDGRLGPDVCDVDAEPPSYLPGGDGAQDVDDAVGLLLPLLGILLTKQSAAAEDRAQAGVTSRRRHRPPPRPPAASQSRRRSV